MSNSSIEKINNKYNFKIEYKLINNKGRFAMSLDFLAARGGLVSLGHAMFLGIGAYFFY